MQTKQQETQTSAAGQNAAQTTTPTQTEKLDAKIASGAVKVEGKKVVKKENQEKAQTTAPAQPATPATPKDSVAYEDARISKWGDMLWSKAVKELKANGLDLAREKSYIFTIDPKTKSMSYAPQAEGQAVGDNQFVVFVRARIDSFYMKKNARDKIVAQLGIKDVQAAKWRIVFGKASAGVVFLA